MKSMFEKSAIGNMIIMFGPIVFMLVSSSFFLLAMMVEKSNFKSFTIFICGVLLIGFGLFSYSKIINIRKGNWIYFGSINMDRNQKILYFLGYGFMLFGMLCIMGLIVIPNSTKNIYYIN